jgi:hypothetical protein
MIRWLKRALRGPTPTKPLVHAPKRNHLRFDWLEDRVTPAIGAPTLLDPVEPVRVDQASYKILGELPRPANAVTSILAFRDSNRNGRFDAGVDAFVASTAVARGATDFALPVSLRQNAANQFFLVASRGGQRSAAVKTPLIREDSRPPRVVEITGTPNATSVQFQVRFSEPVSGVDASDFQVVRSGTVASGAVSVSGSGRTYSVTVNDVIGEGTLRLDLIDNDSIRDILTKPAQAHALGGAGAGNGSFTGQTVAVDTIAPAVASITRLGEVDASGMVQFEVIFREAVQGVDVGDFAVSGSAGSSIAGVSGAGSTYTVTVTGATSNFVRLELIDNNTITDLVGNLLGGLGLGDGNFESGFLANADSLATLVVPALDINLLGLRVQTSDIFISLSADAGDGKLLGNLLTTVSSLIDLQEAADALNEVLGSVVGLLNSSDLLVGLNDSGSFDVRPESTVDVLTLHVAPVELDLLGALVNTSPIDVSITANSGAGLQFLLGNIIFDLTHLFDDLPGQPLNIDTLNQQLGDLLGLVQDVVGAIAPANAPDVVPHEGLILSLTVPALDLNLLGLQVETSPITVNADAVEGDGKLLGNVLTSLLGTLDATPDKIAQLNNTLNDVLASVVGVLNAADLTISSVLVAALPPALQTLLSPILVAPEGASAPILDLVIASQDGTSPPVDVDLLGLVVTTSNIDAHVSATTGDGQILGNLLYNVANLANPDGSGSLLALLNALGSGNLDSTAGSEGGSLSGETPPLQELLTLELDPIDINLLGLQVQANGSLAGDTTPDPILVTISAQGGDAKLLGNLLGAVSTLVNFEGVEGALNNVLGTVVDLVNSVDLTLPPGTVGSGVFDTGSGGPVEVLDVFIAPVNLDLLGLVVTTSPINLTITANTGDGLVLGNVVAALAHLFDNPPPELTVDDVNVRLEELLADLNAMIPGIDPAPTPEVTLEPDQFLELTVPAIDLNLLGLLLKTQPITVNGFAETGDGNLLGNFLDSLLLTIDATPGNLATLSENLNALLAKVVGVLNVADLTISQAIVDALPEVLQILLSPVLIAPNPGATTQVLDLMIASEDGTTPPVQADLLGLVVTTSDIDAELWAVTGDGQILGNLLFNAANLLNSGNPLSLLLLVTRLAGL